MAYINHTCVMQRGDVQNIMKCIDLCLYALIHDQSSTTYYFTCIV